MRKWKKTAALFLAAGMAALAGCGQIDRDATAVTINGGEDTISLGYVNFVAKYTQASYDLGYGSYLGTDMWEQDFYGTGNTMEEDVKSDLMDSLEEEYLLKAHAGDYGISLTEEETAAIEEAADQFMKDNTEDAVDQLGAASEYVKTMLEYQIYANKVGEAIRSQAQVTVSDEEARVRTFTYAYFSTQDTTDEEGNVTALTDEEKAERKEMAQILTEGNNFMLGADTSGAEVETYSYSQSDTGMAEEVLQAADALSEGQVSSVIEVEDEGYYVVRLDSANDQEKTEENREKLLEEKKTRYLQDVIDQWKEDFSWEVDEKQWGKVTFDIPFAAKGSTQS